MQKKAELRILDAARKLFMQNGFDAVTVRDFAKEAKCSHTSIYVYYKDKRKLLETLALPVFSELREKFSHILQEHETALKKLQRMGAHFVRFGLNQSYLYDPLLTFEGIRVDAEPTDLLNEHRIQLFKQLQIGVAGALPEKSEENILKISQMIFYQLHGAILSYRNTIEPTQEIKARVVPLVESAILYLYRRSKTMNFKQLSSSVYKLEYWLGIKMSVWIMKHDEGVTLIDAGMGFMHRSIQKKTS